MARKDITANRHGGNAESHAAHKDGNKLKDEAEVLEIIREAGSEGITLDEIAVKMNRTPNSISGRVTQLKKDGLVIPNGQRRPTRTGSTAAVLVAATPKNPWEV